MADSIVAPPCAQSTEAADRCGYRHLAAPRGGVEFKIYAYVNLEAEVYLYVEYRGAVRELVAAGIVTRKFLAPRPGRKRVDAAGRSVSLQRRPGIRVVTFKGDLFKAPCLPGVTHELVDEAVEQEKELWEESQRRYREMEIEREEDEDEQMTPEAKSIHSQVGTALGRVAAIADDLELSKELIALLAQLEARLLARKSDLAAKRRRAGFLRLVVDNEVRP